MFWRTGMILKLRRRFIRIAMLSFTLVLVLLVTAVNLVNYFSSRRNGTAC